MKLLPGSTTQSQCRIHNTFQLGIDKKTSQIHLTYPRKNTQRNKQISFHKNTMQKNQRRCCLCSISFWLASTSTAKILLINWSNWWSKGLLGWVDMRNLAGNWDCSLAWVYSKCSGEWTANKVASISISFQNALMTSEISTRQCCRGWKNHRWAFERALETLCRPLNK